MPKKSFYKNYFEIFKSKISFSEEIFRKMEKVEKLILNVKRNNKKILIFGNGGSALLLATFLSIVIISLKFAVLILMRQVF